MHWAVLTGERVDLTCFDRASQRLDDLERHGEEEEFGVHHFD